VPDGRPAFDSPSKRGFGKEKARGCDIRMPIGALFTVLGLLLSIYGEITRGSEIHALLSLGLNVSLGGDSSCFSLAWEC